MKDESRSHRLYCCTTAPQALDKPAHQHLRCVEQNNLPQATDVQRETETEVSEKHQCSQKSS